VEQLDQIACRQWGLLTRSQVLLHLKRHQLEWMLNRKQLLLMTKGVYRMAGAPTTWQQAVAAQLLVMPDAVASHITAAAIHGLRMNRDNVVHLTVPKRRSHARDGVRVHQSDVAEQHRTMVRGIRCTTVERTIIDVASVLTRGQLAFMLNEAVVGGKTTYQRVHQALMDAGSNGRKGAKQLRSVLTEHLPLPEGIDSGIVLQVLKAVEKTTLPRPVIEHRVLTRLGPYFIDVAWPEHKVGAEADGYNVHATSRKRHSGDRRRRNELETLNWKILNFTFDMTTAEIAVVLRANLVQVQAVERT
jgi:hypothetical protein